MLYAINFRRSTSLHNFLSLVVYPSEQAARANLVQGWVQFTKCRWRMAFGFVILGLSENFVCLLFSPRPHVRARWLCVTDKTCAICDIGTIITRSGSAGRLVSVIRMVRCSGLKLLFFLGSFFRMWALDAALVCHRSRRSS